MIFFFIDSVFYLSYSLNCFFSFVLFLVSSYLFGYLFNFSIFRIYFFLVNHTGGLFLYVYVYVKCDIKDSTCDVCHHREIPHWISDWLLDRPTIRIYASLRWIHSTTHDRRTDASQRSVFDDGTWRGGVNKWVCEDRETWDWEWMKDCAWEK